MYIQRGLTTQNISYQKEQESKQNKTKQSNTGISCIELILINPRRNQLHDSRRKLIISNNNDDGISQQRGLHDQIDWNEDHYKEACSSKIFLEGLIECLLSGREPWNMKSREHFEILKQRIENKS